MSQYDAGGSAPRVNTPREYPAPQSAAEKALR